jgi:hypothetical protein
VCGDVRTADRDLLALAVHRLDHDGAGREFVVADDEGETRAAPVASFIWAFIDRLS